MKEYIDREVAVAVIEEKQKELCPVGRYGRGYVYGSDREKYDKWDEIIDSIENLPAADVVEVVRCKDCQCWDKLDGYDYIGMCDYHLHTVYDDAFCSYGERREENGEN